MVIDEFEVRFPWIDWREPLPVGRLDDTGRRIACRLCIARFGLKAQEIETTPFCFADQIGFDAHMRATH
jgi:hypothetical protein